MQVVNPSIFDMKYAALNRPASQGKHGLNAVQDPDAGGAYTGLSPLYLVNMAKASWPDDCLDLADVPEQAGEGF